MTRLVPFSVGKMSGNGCDLGRSILDEHDERVVSGQPSKEDFLSALKGYLAAMQERCPDVSHPGMDFLTNSFSMLNIAPSQTVTTPPEPALLEETVRDEIRHQMQASILQPLVQVQKRLEKHSSPNMVIEINSRQYQVS